jgi:CO/xanthine dehydrogenase FAD-binding subunit
VDLPGITDVADARREAWRPGDAWLAGGTWLFSEPQPPELSRLLDLHAYGWPALRVLPDGLEIAATCTLAELARAELPPWPAASLIGRCSAALLGSFKVWNAATVGGNICLSLPAGPMISLTAALDGMSTIWAPGGGERQVPVAEFVTGPSKNVLQPGDLLRSVWLPAAALNDTTAFRQLSLSPLGRSAAVVIGRRARADGSRAGGSLVITVTAATPRPVQLRFATVPGPERLLNELATAVPRYHDDVHGSPAWREEITRQLALEVLSELGAP